MENNQLSLSEQMAAKAVKVAEGWAMINKQDWSLQDYLEMWEVQLRNLLQYLAKGEINLIEFGQPGKNLSDVYTRIRIRRQPDYTVTHVHVFYGEHAPNRDWRVKEPAHYPMGVGSVVEALVADVMAEVTKWTASRAEIGKNFTVNINEDLQFVGYVFEPKRLKQPGSTLTADI